MRTRTHGLQVKEDMHTICGLWAVEVVAGTSKQGLDFSVYREWADNIHRQPAHLYIHSSTQDNRVVVCSMDTPPTEGQQVLMYHVLCNLYVQVVVHTPGPWQSQTLLNKCTASTREGVV